MPDSILRVYHANRTMFETYGPAADSNEHGPFSYVITINEAVGPAVSTLNRIYLGNRTSSQAVGPAVDSNSQEVSLTITQSFTWNDKQSLTAQFTFVWNDGSQPFHWYRVKGCCITPSADFGSCPTAGSSTTSSGGSPGGCEQVSFRADDSNCPSYSIQNVAAQSLEDLCKTLKEQNWNWPICSIGKFSRPADNSAVDPADPCNILEQVDVSDVPECFDLFLHSDTTVCMEMNPIIEVSFARYIGSGGIIIGGSAPSRIISGGGEYGPDLQYYGSGGILIGGSAPCRVISYNVGNSVDMVMSVDVQDIAVDFATEDDSPAIPVPTNLVSTSCGNCTRIPQVIHLGHNLDSAATLIDFLNRNGLIFSEDILMRYSKRQDAWQANVHFSGFSDDGITEESWRILFEWACVDSLGGQDLGTFVWKFSTSVLRTNLATNFNEDTRLLLVFPTDNVCPTTSTSFSFGFDFDTQQLTVNTDLDIVVEVRLLYDNIGLFKSALWATNPLLSIQLNELIPATLPYNQFDIKPIFPLDPALV
jgi:hypothetical protein